MDKFNIAPGECISAEEMQVAWRFYSRFHAIFEEVLLMIEKNNTRMRQSSESVGNAISESEGQIFVFKRLLRTM